VHGPSERTGHTPKTPRLLENAPQSAGFFLGVCPGAREAQQQWTPQVPESSLRVPFTRLAVSPGSHAPGLRFTLLVAPGD